MVIVVMVVKPRPPRCMIHMESHSILLVSLYSLIDYCATRHSLSISLGNVYIADYANSRIRKVTIATGIISTIAGGGSTGFSGDGGPATSAKLNGPQGIAVDASGIKHYITMFNAHYSILFIRQRIYL